MQAFDVTGTPFVFAAWVTGTRGGMRVARLIDHVPCDEAVPGEDCAMEEGEVLLRGVDAAPGAVVLSDRAIGGTDLGVESFELGGCGRIVGFAADPEEALLVVRSRVAPGSGRWPDLRAEAYPPCAEEEEAFAP